MLEQDLVREKWDHALSKNRGDWLLETKVFVVFPIAFAKWLGRGRDILSFRAEGAFTILSKEYHRVSQVCPRPSVRSSVRPSVRSFVTKCFEL